MNASSNVAALPSSQPTLNAAAPTAPGGPSGAPSQPQHSILTTIAPFITLFVIIGMVVFVTHKWEFWTGQADIQETDNAYIKSDMAGLKTKVGGYVRAVYASDYETVTAGQVIAEIGAEDYRLALASSEASLASAKATLDNTDNEMALQNASIVQAAATLDSSRATLNKADLELRRQQQLRNISAAQTLESAETDFAIAQSGVKKDAAALDYQHRQLDVLNGQRKQRQAEVDAAKVSVDTAVLNLGYTKVVAPFDGVVSSRSVQPGDYISSGTQVISIVPLPHVYIVANYKETQLTHVSEGQPVSIEVDTFPGEEIRGRVGRVSPATGSEFALLPSDNATGNFTKVVQRIPVRIEIDPSQDQIKKLRPGMSVVTKIDTDGPKVAPYKDLQPLRKIREMGGDVDVSLN